MKLLGFLISLLLHLLFLLLVISVQFPLIVPQGKPQIIRIVPMSPPSAGSRPLRAPAALAPVMPLALLPAPGRPPRVPAKVYIRPFVLQGGDRGADRGRDPGQGTKAEAASPPVKAGSGGSAAATAGLAQPKPGLSPSAIFPAAAPETTGERSTLKVDSGTFSRVWRGQKTTGEWPGNSGSAAERAGTGLPFGDPHAGSEGDGLSPGSDLSPGGDLSPRGDGTHSHAFGGNAYFDSRGYDITPWAKRMVYRVKKNWIPPAVSEYGLKGMVGIYLRVGRDGAIDSIHIRKTSGIRPFDQAAFNAIELSAPLPPLPDDFPNADLPAYLIFYYK